MLTLDVACTDDDQLLVTTDHLQSTLDDPTIRVVPVREMDECSLEFGCSRRWSVLWLPKLRCSPLEVECSLTAETPLLTSSSQFPSRQSF